MICAPYTNNSAQNNRLFCRNLFNYKRALMDLEKLTQRVATKSAKRRFALGEILILSESAKRVNSTHLSLLRCSKIGKFHAYRKTYNYLHHY